MNKYDIEVTKGKPSNRYYHQPELNYSSFIKLGQFRFKLIINVILN